jgi:hypothetical protein
MPDPHEFPGLDALQRAMAAGDIDGIRHQLLALDESEQQVLETRLGRDAVRRMYARARRVRRARPLGRVVVIHGIMGSRLDAVD